MSQQLQLAEQSNMIREANAALSVTNLELDAKNEHLTSTNARLEIANERLAALNNEKDELLGIVAHDLKNPLTTIMMASSSLASSVVLPDRVAILGARILHTSERMLSIITKLLNLNALEQGATKLNIRSVNVVETVKAIVEEHRIHAQSKGIDVKLMNTNSSIILATDESLIAEIVENLLDNALKYSPKEKRVWIRMEEVMKGDSRKKWLELRVQDEGQGFSEEDKTKVFGKFVRLSAKPTDGEESTGLGLSIVKRLAEMLGGTIALESEKEQGATFILVLPSLEL
jgi:signal transduction histidine kinase